MIAIHALAWVLIRLAFMAYQMTLAFYDIFINGFRHEIGLAEYVTKRVTDRR